MSLFVQADLEDAFPEATQLLALDDDADGTADEGVFVAILQAATDWITGYLQQAGAYISDPPQARLKHLGLRYAEYSLWRRRSQMDQAEKVYDQWIKPGMAWLDRIANGKESLAPETTSNGAAVAIVEEAKTYLDGGGLMA